MPGDLGIGRRRWLDQRRLAQAEQRRWRAAARQEVVAEALDTVAMLFGWERPGED